VSEELSFADLAKTLTDTVYTPCGEHCVGKECPEKTRGAWAPHSLTEGTPRAKENVLTISALVADVDKLDLSAAEALAAQLEALPHAWFSYSTHSCDPAKGAYAFRLVFELSRPVLAREWPTFWAQAMKELAVPHDTSCKDASRLYFVNRVPKGRESFTNIHEGRPLDVQGILDRARAAPRSAPPPPPAQVTDLYDLRASLRRCRAKGEKELITSVLAGEPLALPGKRDTNLNALTFAMARLLPPGVSTETAQAIARPSITAMETEPEGLYYWLDLFDQKLARHRKQIEEERARRATFNKDAGKALREVAEDAERGPKADSGIGGEWADDLDYTADGDIKNTMRNVETILRNSPEWKGVIVFNTFSRRVELRGGPLKVWLPETLHTAITVWLQGPPYRLSCNNSKAVMEIAARIAAENPYDPVQEYLNGLEWDGVDRLDTAFERYLGVDVERDGAEYVREISRRFFIGLAARGLRPGCQLDTVVILEGKQGVGKSTFVRMLGGAWGTSSAPDLGTKEARMVATKYWLAELNELEGMRKVEKTRIKAFIAECVDTYRVPYAATPSEFPRRSVFIGTTNSEDYLEDETGNRRYWPVRVTRLDREALAADRDQLFAEAVARLEAGEVWHMTGEHARRAEANAQARVGADGDSERIVDWLRTLEPEKRPEWVRPYQVLDHLASEGSGERRSMQGISRSLRLAGFERTKQRIDGVPSSVTLYRLPDWLRTAPRVGKTLARGISAGTIMQQVASA